MHGLHEEFPHSATSEDPEVAAYKALGGEHPDTQKAVALALLALVREVKGLRRDISKLGGKAPTIKGRNR